MENITQGQFWSSTASADLGDEIEQSLRFFDGAKLEADVQNDFGNFSADCTLSFWIKFANQAGGSIWFVPNIGGNGYDRSVSINTSNQFQVRYTGNQSPSYSTECFRDKSAWYHVMVISESDNVKLYVNGDLITHHTAGGWTSGTSAYSGDKMSFSSSDERMYYLAEVNFLDGHKATVGTDLGRTNADGIWVPVAPDFTAAEYGTNGFRLQFNDSSNLGDDSAPIGSSGHTTARDFTASSFETTAISSSNFDNDIDYEDTPTKNYPIANLLSSRHGEVDHAGLRTRNSSTGNSHSFSATMAVDTGKWYWEMEVEALGEHQFHGIGRADDAFYPLGANPGTSANGGVNYMNNATKQVNGTTTSYGATYTTGDILGVALNLDDGEITFYKNNTSQGVAATGLSGSFLPGFGHYNNGDANINFGQRPFVYTPPSGYGEINSSVLTEPTIKNGRKYFDVVTYTGTTGDDVITGLNFQPDFVWIKRRDSAGSHILADSVRGVNKGVHSDRTDAEFDDSSTVKAFNSDGFTVGDNSQAGANGATFVGYCWKGGGTAVSNSDGNRTSSISANTVAGFSVVTWTGNATQNATVGHGLTKAPELIFIKNRSDSNDWIVYTTAVDGSVDYGHLNGSAAFGAASNNAPTSSVFSVWDDNGSNGDGDNMLAYCWHSVEGFSKVGTYEGNNNSNGTFEYLGFKPALVVFRNVDATGSWIFYDSTRDTSNPVSKRVTANVNNSEGTSSSMEVDFLSNGFKHRNTDQDLNTSHTYIYMAFAENPFAGENVPPVTAR